jgi:heme-degrading monooxygenase HmoA
MVDPSEIEELKQLWAENGKKTEGTPGRISAYHLSLPEDPSVIRAISMWETREDAINFAESEISKSNLAKARRFYTADPTWELYHVADT